MLYVNNFSILEMILNIMFCLYQVWLNPFKPEFTIVIFIHYKPRIAIAILDL